MDKWRSIYGGGSINWRLSWYDRLHRQRSTDHYYGRSKHRHFLRHDWTSLTMPTAATATQFIVIEKPSCSIFAQGRVKPIVNTTSYNVNPDGTSTDVSAFPGLSYPFPEGAENNDATGVAIGNPGDYIYSMNKLNQPIYILPGQTFENKFIPLSGVTGATIVPGGDGQFTPGDSVVSFTTYSVYDGHDALIASKLVEMGYPVSMSNVDWYKRQLLAEAGGASA